MAAKVAVQHIHKQLFAEAGRNVYAVLDGASVPDLPQVLWEHQPEHVCLYRGDLEPDLAATAPYLVRLEPKSATTDWVIAEGWGKHWGIFAVAPREIDLRVMRKHFRGFLIVKDPEGKSIYFRYYDPRVLQVYLRTCTEEELRFIFGPVSDFFMEAEDAQALLRFQAGDTTPMVEKIPETATS